MKFYVFLLIVICPFAAFCQNKVEHYKIYNTAKGKETTLDELMEDMAKADVLYFGEEHTDSIAHVLELQVLQKLAVKYPGKIALAMEMFETDCQPVVNEYLNGLIRERNFLVDARAWGNYADYRPMVEYVKTNHINLIAANAPARYNNMVSRMGLASLNRLDAAGKSHLPPLPIDTATGRYYEKFLAIMGGHTTMQGMQIYQSQNLWDATMGWSVAQYIKGHAGYKVFEVNGGFHSEERLGAMAQLKKYDPQAKALNIASISGNNLSKPEWANYLKMGDYIILTDTKAGE